MKIAATSLLVLAVTAALALSGCGSGRHSADETYYFVAANVKVPYWQTAREGFAKATRDLGVKAEMVGPESYDPRAQAEEMRRIVGLAPSGILLAVTDPELLRPEIDAAIAAGIPVITVDSDAPQSNRLAFVGTNNHDVGLMAGRAAAKAMGGSGNVVVFTINGQINLNERLRGYQEAFAEAGKIKIVETVDMKGDPRLAFDKAVEIAGKRRNEVDAFVCLEALSCEEVAEVLDRAGIKDKVIVAMDTDEGTLRWVREGRIVATVAQRPFTMAYYGLRMLDGLYHHPVDFRNEALLDGPYRPIPTYVDTGATMIDKSNVEQFTQARQASLAPPR